MTQLPPKSVALHIGAHKTATTHLQRSFSAQQSALNDAGVRYYGPDSLRRPNKGLGDLFGLDVYGSPRTPTRTRAEQRDFMFKDGHRLVLSDENFVGVLHDRRGAIVGPLYPKAPERIAALAEAIDAGPIDICIGIRQPASFIKSAYGQMLLSGQAPSFRSYLDQNPLTRIYWPGLIARVRATPGVGRVTVWRHEEYRWRFHKICAALMGDHVQKRIMPFPDKVHQGLSEAAVAQILAAKDAPDLDRVAAAARAAQPVSGPYPAFDPFSPADKAASEADYADQIAAIDRLDGVTILRA